VHAPDLPTTCSGASNGAHDGIGSQLIFENVTELTVEISAPDIQAKVTARTSQDLHKAFQTALEDQKGQSSVKVSLTDICSVGR
jgi:hypothetical protein